MSRCFPSMDERRNVASRVTFIPDAKRPSWRATLGQNWLSRVISTCLNSTPPRRTNFTHHCQKLGQPLQSATLRRKMAELALDESGGRDSPTFCFDRLRLCLVRTTARGSASVRRAGPLICVPPSQSPACSSILMMLALQSLVERFKRLHPKLFARNAMMVVSGGRASDAKKCRQSR